jgi:cytochrome P450
MTLADLAAAYDPYSDAAMSDPFPFYEALRAEGGPHWIGKWNTWVVAGFDDLTKAAMSESCLDFAHGQTPGQLLLGEPVPRTFMTMNRPEHRAWRAVLADDYTPEGVTAQRPHLAALIRKVLAPLLQRGEFDVYRDFANRVMCINAGWLLGLPEQDAERTRALIDDMMHRERGQVGMSSPRNQKAAGELFGYFAGHIAELRRHPEKAERQARRLMAAEIDGHRLGDEELAAYFFSMMVTGSETTPMATAGTLYYLARHPDQKAAVLADHGLIPAAFRETLRYDQPTNMLARRAARDFELGGRQIRAGQNLLFVWASANRDARRFDRADVFDIHRQARRDLSFGVGGHACLGMHLGMEAGTLMLRELLSAIDDYQLVEGGLRRAYGEFLGGFVAMPICITPRA